MESINDCSKMIAKSLELLKTIRVGKNIEEDSQLKESILLLEKALDKLVDDM